MVSSRCGIYQVGRQRRRRDHKRILSPHFQVCERMHSIVTLGFGVLYFNTFFWFWVPTIATYYLKCIYFFSRAYSKGRHSVSHSVSPFDLFIFSLLGSQRVRLRNIVFRVSRVILGPLGATILRALREEGSPLTAICIARRCGLQKAAEVNPTLYKMRDMGAVVHTQGGGKPAWSVPN